MIRPTPRDLYTTDLDRHLYTLERDEPDGRSGRTSAVIERLRDALTTGRESWKKIGVIANFF